MKSGGYALDTFELLYLARGAAFGASYADVYANLPALRVVAFLAVVAAALSVFQIYRPGYRYLFIGVGLLVLGHVIREIGLDSARSLRKWKRSSRRWRKPDGEGG